MSRIKNFLTNGERKADEIRVKHAQTHRGGQLMKRYVHRIVMLVLLVAALAIIWKVLGGR